MSDTMKRWLPERAAALVLALFVLAPASGCSVNIADAPNNACASNEDCDDGLSCTSAVCGANGSCVTSVISGRCFIGGACYLDGDSHPNDACQVCDADGDEIAWTDHCTGGGDASGSDVTQPGDTATSDGTGPDDTTTPPDDTTTPPDDTTTPPDDTVTPPADTVGPPDDTTTPPDDTVTPPDDTVGPPDDTTDPPDDAVDPPDDTTDPPDDTVGPPDDTVDPPGPCEDLPTITSAPYESKTSIAGDSDDLGLDNGDCEHIPQGGGAGGADRTWVFIAPNDGLWQLFAGTDFDAVFYLTEGCPADHACYDGIPLLANEQSEPLFVELAEGDAIYITVDALDEAGLVELEIDEVVCTPSCPPGSCGSDGCGGQCSCGPGQLCSSDSCITIGDELDCLATVDCIDSVCAGDEACAAACLANSTAEPEDVEALYACYDLAGCYPSQPCYLMECASSWLECADHGSGPASCTALAQSCVEGCDLADLACYSDCAATGTDEAQKQFYDVIFCLLGECPNQSEACIQSVMSDSQSQCAQLFETCTSAPCVGSCDGKECGDSGCGEPCGTCGAGLQCIDDLCTEPTPEACCDVQDDVSGCVANAACEECVCTADGFCCESQWDNLCADQANDPSICGGPDACGCCEPQCDGKVCGSDGCAGSCGSCPNGMACQQGACIDASDIAGSCDKPIEIFGAPQSLSDDTTDAGDDVPPGCGAANNGGGPGPDHVYAFTAEETGWYSARLLTQGWPSTLMLQAACGDASSCHGQVPAAGGQLKWFAEEGATWWLVVGSANGQGGLYTLEIDPPCTPQCDGNVCGGDGCGGTCGTCALDQVCITGQCKSPDDPKGNTCQGPIPAGLGTKEGDTSAASNAFDITFDMCDGAGLGSGGNELIYEFKAPEPGLYTAAATSDAFQPLLYVLDECSGPDEACAVVGVGEVFFTAGGPGGPVFIVVDQADWQPSCAPADHLCEISGGQPTECGSGCGPATCQAPEQPELCPPVCFSQCLCPDNAPIWDDLRGCIPLHECALPAGNSDCGGGPFTLEISACVPQCADAECGPDGCGGTCGTCPDDEFCSEGLCGPPTCAGSCGGQSPAGCYCDQACFGFGDCCADVCAHCAEQVDGSCQLAAEPGQLVVTEIMVSFPPFFTAVGDWFEVTNLTDDVIPLSPCDFMRLGVDAVPLADDTLVLLPGQALAIADSSDPQANGGIEGAQELKAWDEAGGPFDLTYAIFCGGELVDEVPLDPLGGGWSFDEEASTQLDPSGDADSNDSPDAWCLSETPYGAGQGTPGEPNEPCK